MPLVVTAVVVFIADFVTKWMAVRALSEQPGQRIVVIPGIFDFLLQGNTGGAFSILVNHPEIITAFSLIAIVVIFAWSRRVPREVISAHIAFGMVLGGAAGNIIDRFRFRYVIDFIQVYILGWPYPTFNVADSAIVLGVGVLIYLMVFTRKLEIPHPVMDAIIAVDAPPETTTPVDAIPPKDLERAGADNG